MSIVGDLGLVEHDPGPCEVHSPGDKTDACTHKKQLVRPGLDYRTLRVQAIGATQLQPQKRTA